MFKILKSTRIKQIVLGTSLGLGALLAGNFYIYRATHPLVKYSRAVLAADNKVKEALGSNGRICFLIHSIANPEDNEYGFTYKVKGKKGYAQVTVIGDYISHKDLIDIDNKKRTVLAECKEDQEKINEAIHNKKFAPVNISRFYIPSKRFGLENNSTPIPYTENIWRVKELIIDTASGFIKADYTDSLTKIIESKYTLKTYADAQDKINSSINIIATPFKVHNLKSNLRNDSSYKKFLLPLIALPLMYLVLYYHGKTPIVNSNLYYTIMATLKTTEAVGMKLGNNITPLWTNGIIHKHFRFASFNMGLFGSKGEGEVKVYAKMPILKKEWNIETLTFIQDKDIIKIK